jgi:hypothetical protein
VELVKLLREQHLAGRRVADEALRLASAPLTAADRSGLAKALRVFVRLYRAHESREDSLLFPQLQRRVTRKEWEELGEHFVNYEHSLFGALGLEGVVAEVAGIEKVYGLDLASFTPPP